MSTYMPAMTLYGALDPLIQTSVWMFSLISYGEKEPIASDTLQEVEKCHDKGNGP